MEQLTTATLTQLPQVRALGRHTGRDPLTLFWTASGMELEFTGSELWVDLFADYEAVEPWVSVELNGAWVARFAVNPGKSRICLFRGMTPGKAKHLRLLKDVQAMHDDPAHLLQITGLEYAGGEFLPLPEPQYRLEFVGDSITSGEGAIGAKPEEDWVGAFFSAENHYGRLTADALGAEYRCISQSGWGIVTGWDNDVRHVMPPYYTQVCGVAMGQRNAALGAQQETILLHGNRMLSSSTWAPTTRAHLITRRGKTLPLARPTSCGGSPMETSTLRTPKKWQMVYSIF